MEAEIPGTNSQNREPWNQLQNPSGIKWKFIELYETKTTTLERETSIDGKLNGWNP